MAKKGMARPEWTHTQPRNDVPPVPELHGKAKHTKEKARPIIAGTSSPELKVYHREPACGGLSAKSATEWRFTPQPLPEDDR